MLFNNDGNVGASGSFTFDSDTNALEVIGLISATGNVTGGNLNAVGLSLSGNVLAPINMTADITTTANVYANNIAATTSINIAGTAVATIDDAAALAIALG